MVVVEEAFRAVVDHDDERLALVAAVHDDVYFWTRDQGSLGDVGFVVAPGSAEEWGMGSEAVVSADGAVSRL